MTHKIEERDGLTVVVVEDQNKRLHPITGKELPARRIDDVIVHAREIARYYGIEYQDIGEGDNLVPGVWTLIWENRIGQRVNYNTGGIEPNGRLVRKWRTIRDAAGLPIDSEEYQEVVPFDAETDDGMYVRLADLQRYARAMGWSAGGGDPRIVKPTAPVVATDVAVLQAQVATLTSLVSRLVGNAGGSEEAAEPKARTPKQRAQDAWLAAGRPEPRDEWKASWVDEHADE